MKKLLLFPCLFTAFISVAQTKLTIESSSSAMVRNDFPTFAFGDDPLIAARQDEGEGFLTTTRSFFQFDLSSIPKGSFVNWARLNLFGFYNNDFPNYGPNSFHLRRITSAWEHGKVTWAIQPSTAKRGTIRLPMSTSPEQDYKNINVTNLVQAMVDSPATGFGFALRLDSDLSGVPRRITFSSVEIPVSRDYPKLVLEYTAPGFQKKVTTMSVGLYGASTEMNIYPNPCNGLFNCNIKSSSTVNMTLRVIDMLGRTVYSQPVKTSSLQMQVSLPSSSAGTYFVILQDGKGATIVSQQLQVN